MGIVNDLLNGVLIHELERFKQATSIFWLFKIYTVKKLVYLVLFLVTFHVISQEKEGAIKDLALNYMKAYSNWDYAKMNTFYTDSIHFKDPTAQEVFGLGYDLVGKDKVTTFFKSIFPNALPEHLSFIIKEHFVSGSHVVVNATFNLILPEGWYGGGRSGKIFVSVPLVTILRFQGEKIMMHHDYVDYNSYLKQIRLQTNQE